MVKSAKSSKASPSRTIYWLASLTLAGILLYYSLRGTEWGRVWTIVSGAKPVLVMLALVTMSFSLFLRAFRWRIILLAEGRVTVALAFWATSAGYLGNNLLPARAGEVVRSLMISGRTGMSKAFVLTTALSERVVDAIALISISSVVLLTLHQGPGWLAQAAKPFALLGFCGIAAIAFIPAFEVFWFKFLAFIPLPQKLRSQVENALRQGLQGIRSFHDRGRLIRFLLLTLLIWSVDTVTTVVAAASVGLTISVPMALLLIAGLGLGSALPSTPGYVGIYQFVAVSVLTPFGLSRTDAIAYILLFQAINYVIVLCFGSIGAMKQHKSVFASSASLS